MIKQSSQHQILQNSNFKVNTNNTLQLNEIQPNRNYSCHILSVRNDTRKDYSSSPISINNNHKINLQKQVQSNQMLSKQGGIAFDCQISERNKQNYKGQDLNKNTSQDKISPHHYQNENLQYFISKPRNKQQKVVISNREYSDYSKDQNLYCEKSECLQLKNKKLENQKGQSQRAIYQKNKNFIHHQGGSKSLDQSTFLKMGSNPSNIILGIKQNNLLNSSTNQQLSINMNNKDISNIKQSYHGYINQNHKIENNFISNRQLQNSNVHTSHTILFQPKNNQTYNQINIQNNMNSNKLHQIQQQLNISSQNNPQISQINKNNARDVFNIHYEKQNIQSIDQGKIGKQYLDFIQNQPYIQSQTENKQGLQFQQLNQSEESNILKESHPYTIYRQNHPHQQQNYNKNTTKENNTNYNQIKEILSNYENNQISQNNIQCIQSKNNNFKSGQNEQCSLIQQQNVQYNSLPVNQNQQRQGSYFNNNFSNHQNQKGILDQNAINISLNQRDISNIKTSNIQDISCFSRDQSIFFEGNKDLSLNIRDFSMNMKDYSLISQNIKKNDNCLQTTNTSGFDLPVHLQQDNYIIQNFDKGEFPTLSNHNLNNSKSSILECLQDISIDFSKVEDISNITEQEKERTSKQIENISNLEDMKDRINQFSDSHKFLKHLKQEDENNFNLLQKIKSLEDENQNLREQIIKSEKFYELKYKDYQFQINKLKQDNDEMIQNLQSKIDYIVSSMNQQKKIYEDKIMKLQQDFDKVSHEQQIKEKNNQLISQRFDSDKSSQTNYEQIVKQIQQEFDIQKENEIISKIKNLVNKDMVKLIECLSGLMVQFAPDGYFEKKPTLKQIWKWLKEILKEYMKNTSDLKQALLYVNASKQDDFIIKLQKIVFENESYCKIIEQVKQFFNLDNEQFSNLYELQLFFEKKNSSKSILNTNSNNQQPL